RNTDAEDEFEFEGEWEKAERNPEPIQVKGEEDIEYDVLETRHGPIVSEFAEESGEEDGLSLRWTALDPTAELQAILEINKASNWRSEEHTSELQSRFDLVCRLLLEKKKYTKQDKRVNI